MFEDAVSQLEHEHEQLNRLVDGLRDSTQAALRGEANTDELRSDLTEFLRVAQDELFEHFDVEETGLFPYLLEQLPDTAEVIRGLESGHDRMCGLLSRMERMLELPNETLEADFDALIALFARFDAIYARHSREEAQLLRDTADRLNPEQRAEVARLVAEI